MDDHAENQQESFPQEPLTSEKPKKKRTGDSSVSSITPAIVWLTTIFFVGMVLGNLLWLLVADVLAFGREDVTVQVSITATDSLKDISKRLAQEGLVSYPGLFRLYAKVTGAADKFIPGTYELSTRFDYYALAKALSSGNVLRIDSVQPLPS